MSAKEIAEHGLIFKAVVGSTLHGLNLPGQDDRDEMGVCIEPPDCVIGLKRFEQWTYRTKPEGVRSGPGDLDSVVYSLRKWARLAANGNPTVLLLLFVPGAMTVTTTLAWACVQAEAKAFLSKRAGIAFLGYLTAQKERLCGERGQKRTKREDLVCRYGYDVKYAMHAFRLGYQGVELLETGRVHLPMPEPWRGAAMAIREGKTLLPVVMSAISSFENRLKTLITESTLPDEPDYAAINGMLQAVYLDEWERSKLRPQPGQGGR